MKPRILIVDDELEMRILLAACLKHEFLTEQSESGLEALEKLDQEAFDLILLDIMMPAMNGFEVLREIREIVNPSIPIVLLTALGEKEKVVKGLDMGADDYVVKPFEPKELVARIKSVLRRTIKTRTNPMLIHGLSIDQDKVRVSYQGRLIPLTKKEFQLLHRLASHLGRVYSREQLLQLEWEYDYEGDTRTVDTHIKNIREKLKQAGFDQHIIETVWGIGYQMIEG